MRRAWITVEPGILQSPKENRRRSNRRRLLITESGHKFLSRRLTRDPDEIEENHGRRRETRARIQKGTIDRCGRSEGMAAHASGTRIASLLPLVDV